MPVQAAIQPQHPQSKTFSDPVLGVRLTYPKRFKIWTSGDAIFLDLRSASQKKTSDYSQVEGIDRAFNGRVHSNDGLYLLRISIGKGDFSSANKSNAIFERQGRRMQVAFGRFQNPPATKITSKQWSGYESTIVCSVDDENGFHAAGGLCYWGLISNGHSYALADSGAVNLRDEKAIRSIIRSMNFVN